MTAARPHRTALGLLAAALAGWALVLGAALAGAAPPADGGRVLALFSPGRGAEANLAAIVRAGARPIGATWAAAVWSVDAGPGDAARLRAEGALVVIAEPALAATLGCGYTVTAGGNAARGAPWRWDS